MINRPIFWLAMALATAGLWPAAVSAHQGNPDYRSEVTAIAPGRDAPGIEAEIVNFDDSVVLRNDSGKTVLVKGYDGEPFARISADGRVEVNLNSPSFYLNQDRYAEVDIPARADADKAPDWKEVDRSGQFAWHDHRSHYMGKNTPPQVTDRSVTTKIFDYSIPIGVGGDPARIKGTLSWVGSDSGFPVAPFAGLGVLVLLGLGWLLYRRNRTGPEGPGGPDGVRGPEEVDPPGS